MESDDDRQAGDLDRARSRLLDSGGSQIERRVWRAGRTAPPDHDLLRYAAWEAGKAEPDPTVLLAGLGLLDAGRAEIDQVEAALLFAARAAGVTWQMIAEALSLGSAQAAQQRLGRVLDRTSDTAED